MQLANAGDFLQLRPPRACLARGGFAGFLRIAERERRDRVQHNAGSAPKFPLRFGGAGPGHARIEALPHAIQPLAQRQLVGGEGVVFAFALLIAQPFLFLRRGIMGKAKGI